ncbi:hypothetical protein [Actinosynnema sp. NPDC020468]|uniref:hypothetical protein n=1 Tax=Actinosynnema sp. NPDC020468 TaxID=3154488 RepID=UPI0033F2932C
MTSVSETERIVTVSTAAPYYAEWENGVWRTELPDGATAEEIRTRIALLAGAEGLIIDRAEEVGGVFTAWLRMDSTRARLTDILSAEGYAVGTWKVDNGTVSLTLRPLT